MIHHRESKGWLQEENGEKNQKYYTCQSPCPTGNKESEHI